MDVFYATPLVIAAAGMFAGGEAAAFLGAAAGAAYAAWRPRMMAHASGIHLFATLEPDAPDGAILLEAVRTALARARRTKHIVLLRVAALRAAGRPALRLGLNRDGDLEILHDGQRARALGQPGIWIADHPLPLALPHTRCLTLRFAPAGDERVRASVATAPHLSRRAWATAALLAAAACACDAAAPLAAVLGFAFQAYLLEHHARRAERQP